MTNVESTQPFVIRHSSFEHSYETSLASLAVICDVRAGRAGRDGVADAAGALTFTVERKQGSWRITGMSQYAPNPERVIIT